MTEVYSYPFPEVRNLLASLRIDERFMLNTLPIVEAESMIAGLGFVPPLALTSRTDRTLDLDELHVPVQARIEAILAKRLTGLHTFAHRYPVHGSSPAIFALLAEWKATGVLTSIAVLAGDYEGYRALAESLQIPITSYPSFENAKPRRGEIWFTSNPSARDGNWIPAEEWSAFVASGCAVVVDAAYVGLTADDVSIDVSAQNILAVLTSPSKIFGVFRYRLTGTTFVRAPITAMYANKWFKDIPALLQTLALYEQFADNWLPKSYRHWQHDICFHLEGVVEAPIHASDTILLASAQGPVAPRFDSFQRGSVLRFGLTKTFEDYERQMS